MPLTGNAVAAASANYVATAASVPASAADVSAVAASATTAAADKTKMCALLSCNLLWGQWMIPKKTWQFFTLHPKIINCHREVHRAVRFMKIYINFLTPSHTAPPRTVPRHPIPHPLPCFENKLTKFTLTRYTYH